MSLLLNKTPPADIRNHVLPMIARALEANQQQIQVNRSLLKSSILIPVSGNCSVQKRLKCFEFFSLTLKSFMHLTFTLSFFGLF